MIDQYSLVLMWKPVRMETPGQLVDKKTVHLDYCTHQLDLDGELQNVGTDLPGTQDVSYHYPGSRFRPRDGYYHSENQHWTLDDCKQTVGLLAADGLLIDCL